MTPAEIRGEILASLEGARRGRRSRGANDGWLTPQPGAWADFEAANAWDEASAIPTEVDGKMLRSRLEASWARTFKRYGIKWDYEADKIRLSSGKGYWPDFRLPELSTVIEVKGPHMNRLDKTREYAREVWADTLVIVGYWPLSRSVSPCLWQPFMQWGHPLGYFTVFTECVGCRARQWCCPRQSVACRKCGDSLDRGHFAGNGELPFDDWDNSPMRPIPEASHGPV